MAGKKRRMLLCACALICLSLTGIGQSARAEGASALPMDFSGGMQAIFTISVSFL